MNWDRARKESLIRKHGAVQAAWQRTKRKKRRRVKAKVIRGTRSSSLRRRLRECPNCHAQIRESRYERHIGAMCFKRDTVARQPVIFGEAVTEGSGLGTTRKGVAAGIVAKERYSSRSVRTIDVPEGRRQLIEFRERVLRPRFSDIAPTRGLLRRTVLDALLRQRPTSNAEWVARLPS